MARDEAAQRRGETPDVRVTLAELARGSGFVALNDQLDVAAGELFDVCEGESFTLDAPERFGRQPGLTEDRLARRLGMNRARLTDESLRLWQCTFSEERDRRAIADGNDK
jgi:hypothetical protein